VLLGARRSSGIKEVLNGDLDLVRISSAVLYNANFTPPVHWDMGPGQPYVALSWGAPATGGTPTGYFVYRGTNAEDPLEVTPAAVPSLAWSDANPVDGILVYQIKAVNNDGESALTTPVTVTFGAGPAAPAAPAQAQAQLVHRIVPLAGTAVYRLDEAAGSVSQDGTVCGHLLTLGGATAGDAAEPAWIDGRAGSGLHFDGLDDAATAADDSLLRFGAGFTLEAWCRFAAPGKYGVLMAKESTNAGRNYRMAITATGKLELQWKNTAGTTYTLTSASPLTATAWHHVAAVFDPALAESRLFVDGQPAGKLATAGMPLSGNAALRLGARQSSSLKDFFLGDLDLVRLAPQALYRDPFVPPAMLDARPVC
jgi:hypothetical protein